MRLLFPLPALVLTVCAPLCAGNDDEVSANTLTSEPDSTNRTRLTIIHYDFAHLNGSVVQTDSLMQKLQAALVAFPHALLLNPTGHLGKRLWIQHDGSAPNLADILQPPAESETRSSDIDPLLAANVRVPGSARIHRSTVRQLPDQQRVGIVGFVSERRRLEAAVDAMHVQVSEAEMAVRKEAQRLRGNGVPVIVALGNAGYPEDEMVASRVEEVDVVVAAGGSGDGYPVALQQEGGKVVPLLQAPPNSVCMTTLVLDSGTLVDWGGIRIPVAMEDGNVEVEGTEKTEKKKKTKKEEERGV